MQKITLDLVPGKKMPSLHASQFDDGRTHGIDLYENGIEYKLDGTELLTINERKGDGNICSIDIENTFVGSSHIVFASTEQMCAVAGANICELVIAKGETTIGTLNFILEIEPSPTEGGIESDSEIKNLKRQIEAITEEVIGDDYYTAEETDEAIATAVEGKADTTYVNEELAKKADKTNTYTKTQVDNSLNNKMNRNNPTGNGKMAIGSVVSASGANSQAFGDVVTASGRNAFASGYRLEARGNYQHVFGKYNEVDDNNEFAEIIGNGTSNSARSNARTLDWDGNETLAGDLTYNGNKRLSSEISRLDGRITNLPEAMVFKGTLGVNGDIQTLPTASAEIEGWTFKCITAGTYAGLTLKVGDSVTCFNPPNTSVYEWDISGYGDTDTDTWRTIKVNGEEKLGSGISSGSVDFENTANVKFEFDANGNKIKANLDGIYTESDVDDLLDDKADKSDTYTQEQVDNIVSDAIYNILPSELTPTGAIANFNTTLELPIVELTAGITPTQEAGEPTPSTPKAITAWSAVNLDANGTAVVIALGGTYYGGYLTQNKAGKRVITVTYEVADMGDLAWGRFNFSGVYCFYVNIPLMKSNYAKGLSSVASRSTVLTPSSLQNNQFLLDNGTHNGYIYLRADDYSDATTFKTAMAGQKLVYELATPYTVEIADGEPINTINGDNNFSVDTGNIAVEYKVSIEQYVSNHSGGGIGGGLLGGGLGGAKSGGSEEEPDEGEDTEKTKLDEPKEEIKTIGDAKKLDGE